MKVVGIRELKNRLSEYIRLVRNGERVLVTDRGVIVAEIRQPGAPIDEDPYPIYRWLRDEQPIYHNEKLDFWAVTRFEDCWNAYLDFETFSSARGTVLELMETDIASGSLMIFMATPTPESAAKGTFPVSISYITTPSE